MEGVKRSSKELRDNTSLPRKPPTQTSTANVSSSSRPIPPKLGADSIDSAAKDIMGKLVDQVNTSFKESTIEVIGLIEGSLQRFLADLSSIRKKISQSKIANPSVIIPEIVSVPPPVLSSGTHIVKEWNASGVSSPKNLVKVPTPGGPVPIIQPARAHMPEEKEKKERESRDRIGKMIQNGFDGKYQRPIDSRPSSKYTAPQIEQPPQMATRRTRGVGSSTGGINGPNHSSGTVLVTGPAIPSRRSMANLPSGVPQGQTSSNQGGLPRPARKTSRRSHAKVRESSSEKIRAVGSSLEDADSDKSDRGRKLIVKAGNELNNQKKRGRKPRAPSEAPISLGKRILPKAKPDTIVDSEVKEAEKPVRKEPNNAPKDLPQKEMKESKESQKAEPLTVIRETKEPLKDAQSPVKSGSQRRIAALPKETPDRAAQEEPSVAIIPNPASRMALINSLLPEQNIPPPRTASMSLSLQNRRKQIQKENEELSRIEESCKIELAALSKPFKPSASGTSAVTAGSEIRPSVDAGATNPQNQNPVNDPLDPTGARRRLKKNSKAKGGNEEEDADQVVEDMTITKENLNVGADNIEDSIVINIGGRPKIGGMARRSKPSSQVPVPSANSTQASKSLLNLLDQTSSLANSTLGAISTDATSIGATQVPTDDELAKRKPQHYTLEAFFYKQGAAFKPTSSISKDPSISKIKPEKYDSRFSSHPSQAGASITNSTIVPEQVATDSKSARAGSQANPTPVGSQEPVLPPTQTSRRSNSSAKGPNGLGAPVRETQELSRILDLAGLRK